MDWFHMKKSETGLIQDEELMKKIQQLASGSSPLGILRTLKELDDDEEYTDTTFLRYDPLPEGPGCWDRDR
jgi:hypothetical protein